jgi:hypothetical protein
MAGFRRNLRATPRAVVFLAGHRTCYRNALGERLGARSLSVARTMMMCGEILMTDDCQTRLHRRSTMSVPTTDEVRAFVDAILDCCCRRCRCHYVCPLETQPCRTQESSRVRATEVVVVVALPFGCWTRIVVPRKGLTPASCRVGRLDLSRPVCWFLSPNLLSRHRCEAMLHINPGSYPCLNVSSFSPCTS